MVDSAELSVDSLKTAIGDILKSSELSSLTSRIVRNNLEERFNVNLKHRKKEIDELLMSMIEEIQAKQNEDSDVPTNGAVDANNESQSDDEDNSPATKKVKKEKKSKESKSKATNKRISKKDVSDSEPEDEVLQDHDDAEIARKLQENERGRLRKRKQPAKRTQKSSTKKDPKPKGERSRSGFGKLMILSPELAVIMGADQLSRSEVVKKMWQVIRERNLTDPKDKRFHNCDPQLLKVFGIKRVKTFSMMKYLKQHIMDPDLLT